MAILAPLSTPQNLETNKRQQSWISLAVVRLKLHPCNNWSCASSQNLLKSTTRKAYHPEGAWSYPALIAAVLQTVKYRFGPFSQHVPLSKVRLPSSLYTQCTWNQTPDQISEAQRLFYQMCPVLCGKSKLWVLAFSWCRTRAYADLQVLSHKVWPGGVPDHASIFSFWKITCWSHIHASVLDLVDMLRLFACVQSRSILAL